MNPNDKEHVSATQLLSLNYTDFEPVDVRDNAHFSGALALDNAIATDRHTNSTVFNGIFDRTVVIFL